MTVKYRSRRFPNNRRTHGAAPSAHELIRTRRRCRRGFVRKIALRTRQTSPELSRNEHRLGPQRLLNSVRRRLSRVAVLKSYLKKRPEALSSLLINKNKKKIKKKTAPRIVCMSSRLNDVVKHRGECVRTCTHDNFVRRRY